MKTIKLKLMLSIIAIMLSFLVIIAVLTSNIRSSSDVVNQMEQETFHTLILAEEL